MMIWPILKNEASYTNIGKKAWRVKKKQGSKYYYNIKNTFKCRLQRSNIPLKRYLMKIHLWLNLYQIP